MKISRKKLLSISVACLFPLLAMAVDREALKQDNSHIRNWSQFAEDALKLHEKLTMGKGLTVKKTVGSYANQKDFYIQEQFFDGNRLISQVQWEKNNLEQLHTIEVFIHDKSGRVIRDFAAAYLPFYHNAPNQTLISFHHYNGDLHAFRSFDASGDMILERCKGKDKQGKVVNILMDEDDLYNDPDDISETVEYKSCFDGLKQDRLGKYLVPQ